MSLLSSVFCEQNTEIKKQVSLMTTNVRFFLSHNHNYDKSPFKNAGMGIAVKSHYTIPLARF